ncbi:MAG: hypothetical protein V7629_21100 [Motiliproteus sp.]
MMENPVGYSKTAVAIKHSMHARVGDLNSAFARRLIQSLCSSIAVNSAIAFLNSGAGFNRSGDVDLLKSPIQGVFTEFCLSQAVQDG